MPSFLGHIIGDADVALAKVSRNDVLDMYLMPLYQFCVTWAGAEGLVACCWPRNGG